MARSQPSRDSGDAGRGHVFRTQSDCEVIPHLYLDRATSGCSSPQVNFRGGSARSREAADASGRDHAGVKPLFYYVSDDRKLLVFASSSRPYSRMGPCPGRSDWQSAFTDWLVPDTAPRELTSGFRGIEPRPRREHVWTVSLIDGTSPTQEVLALAGQGKGLAGRVRHASITSIVIGTCSPIA